MNRSGRFHRCLLATSAAVALLPAAAGAQTITVSPGSGDDFPPVATDCASGAVTPCTLRDAIAYADNGTAGTNPTIQLPAGNIALSGGALQPSVDMTVAGATPTSSGPATTITQNGTASVFAPTGTPTLVLNYLTLTGGNAANGSGGAVDTPGSLQLDQSVITGNKAQGVDGTAGGPGGTAMGGALAVGGSLSMADVTITGNVTQGGRGGAGLADSNGGPGGDAEGTVYADIAGISHSTISGNQVIGGAGGTGNGTGNGGNGGAARGGALEVNGSGVIGADTFTGNTVTAGAGAQSSGTGTGGTGGEAAGGGAFLSGTSTWNGDLTSGNSAIAGAGAGGEPAGTSTGGAFAARPSANVSLTNEVLYDNAANSGSAIDVEGAGAAVFAIETTIVAGASGASDTTLSAGGAMSGGTLTLRGTAVDGGSIRCKATSGATIADGGHNAEDDTAGQCGFTTAGHDVLAADLGLPSAPGANGGPIDTFALAPASPLIGAGDCTDTTFDAREYGRGTGCDIGSFQSEPVTVGTPAITGVLGVGQTVTCDGSRIVGGDGPLNPDGSVGALVPAYVWYRNGVAIATATGQTYTAQAADAGQALSCSISAAGAYGQASATSASVTVPTQGTTICSAGVCDQMSQPPPTSSFRLSLVGQSSRRWSETKRKGVAHGTTFRFTLDAGASVTIAFTRRETGRKVHGRCVMPTRKNRRASRCARTVRAGSLKRTGVAGLNSVAFDGRIGRHTLAPGVYTAKLSATSGGVTRTATLRFTIVGRR